MPKKFSTENPKAVAARERKKAVKDAESNKKQRQEEDAYWQDNDKQIKKKQQRKEEQDKKREQQLAKKAEAKQLLEQEMSSIKSGKVNPPAKITRSQINWSIAKKEDDKPEKVVTHLDTPLEENINRLTVEGEEARSVTEAIQVLSTKSKDADKHPERRRKAAFAAFEDRRLQQLKAENPTLRLTQLKQMIFKEWQKSSENPMNNLTE